MGGSEPISLKDKTMGKYKQIFEKKNDVLIGTDISYPNLVVRYHKNIDILYTKNQQWFLHRSYV